MDVARDNILDRVRTALRAPAHRPLPPTDAPIFPPPVREFRCQIAIERVIDVAHGARLTVRAGLAFISSFQ